MVIAAIVLAVVFALACGTFITYALRARKDTIPFRSFSPVIGRYPRLNERTWVEMHRRAVPNLWTAAAVCLVQAIAFAVLAAYPKMLTDSYMITLAVVGVGLCVTLMWLAGRR